MLTTGSPPLLLTSWDAIVVKTANCWVVVVRGFCWCCSPLTFNQDHSAQEANHDNWSRLEDSSKTALCLKSMSSLPNSGFPAQLYIDNKPQLNSPLTSSQFPTGGALAKPPTPPACGVDSDDNQSLTTMSHPAPGAICRATFVLAIS